VGKVANSRCGHPLCTQSVPWNIGVVEFRTWWRQHLAHIQKRSDVCPKQQKQLKGYPKWKPKVTNGVKGYRVKSSCWWPEIRMCLVRMSAETPTQRWARTFWDITPCGPFKVRRRFGRTYRLYLQGRKIGPSRNQHENRWQPEPSRKLSCLAYSYTLRMKALCSCETSVDFKPIARRYIPENRTRQPFWCIFRGLPQSLHATATIVTLGHYYYCPQPCTVFARSEAGTVGSNPTQSMNV
jgi:hypothetical protein